MRKKSSLFCVNDIHHLPNLLDTNVFSPFNRVLAKQLFDLPLDKHLVVFGAIKVIADINKGYHELFNALNLINDPDVEIVIFGCSNQKVFPRFHIIFITLGIWLMI